MNKWNILIISYCVFVVTLSLTLIPPSTAYQQQEKYNYCGVAVAQTFCPWYHKYQTSLTSPIFVDNTTNYFSQDFIAQKMNIAYLTWDPTPVWPGHIIAFLQSPQCNRRVRWGYGVPRIILENNHYQIVIRDIPQSDKHKTILFNPSNGQSSWTDIDYSQTIGMVVE